MHVAIFLQHYHTPDCPTAARPYALVERLARDHDVTVITTRAWEDKRKATRYPWVPDGADLIRLDVPYDNSMSSAQRLMAFLKYATRAVYHGLTMSKPDLIIGSSTPLTAAMAAAIVASVRGIPWVFEVRDLWPDFPIQMGALPWTSVQQLLYRLERWLYESAAHVVALSEDMTRHVEAVAPDSEVTTMEYGADFRLLNGECENRAARVREKYDLNSRFLVVYGGTFGRANAIPTILTTAKQFSENDDIIFALAGQGYYESDIDEAAGSYDHIRKLPPLAYPRALSLFSLADVSLVTFLDKPVLAANSPGKLFDSLAAGTPIIVTNPGWTKRLVEENGCGWYVPPQSPDALTDQIRDLLDAPERVSSAQENAERVAEDQYDRSARMDEYADLVDDIHSSGGG